MFPTVLALCTCILAGLKTPMCGTNSSLTSDLAFTSSNGKITLIFRRNSSGVKNKASFNMTFIAFYEGKRVGNGRGKIVWSAVTLFVSILTLPYLHISQ